MHYRTTILAGKVDVGTAGMRLVGIFWLIAAIGVGIAAIHVFRNTDRAMAIAWMAVAFSSVMTIVGWPESKTGVALNVVIMGSLVWPLVG